MDFLSDSVALSRLQFAITAIFHMIWPVLTTGMSIYLVVVEGLWLKTRNPDYYYHARFWSKLFGHLSGEQVHHQQPTKMVAMEAQWETVPSGEPLTG